MGDFWAAHYASVLPSLWPACQTTLLFACLTATTDVGDFWAAYYKFEGQFGGAEQQEAVLRRFAAAEPRHGERWQRAAKDPANAHAKPEALLKQVAADLDKDVQ